MSKHSEIDTRMKTYYEQIPKTRLTRRTPVAIRLDGKAFHTLTRNFERPFDQVMIQSMQATMQQLCENIQGCVLGYTQSDEITLILVDYKKLTSSAWFDSEVQKICSVSASMATSYFQFWMKYFSHTYIDNLERSLLKDLFNANSFEELTDDQKEKFYQLKEDSEDRGLARLSRAYDAAHHNALFDSRCFNIPKEEVANLIYWRQQDATRNSIEMASRAYYSHKELDHVNQNQMQEMLFQKGINWNDYPVPCKRGSCCIKETYFVDKEGNEIDSSVCEDATKRSRWIVDQNIPIFVGAGRKYIEDLIYIDETPSKMRLQDIIGVINEHRKISIVSLKGHTLEQADNIYSLSHDWDKFYVKEINSRPDETGNKSVIMIMVFPDDNQERRHKYEVLCGIPV